MLSTTTRATFPTDHLNDLPAEIQVILTSTGGGDFNYSRAQVSEIVITQPGKPEWEWTRTHPSEHDYRKFADYLQVLGYEKVREIRPRSSRSLGKRVALPSMQIFFERHGDKPLPAFITQGAIMTEPPAIKQSESVIRVDAIRINGGTQTRAGLNQDTVNAYAEALVEGADFPPVIVFFDGKEYWLADGFHRVAAYRQIEAQEIRADVRQGSQRDAVLYSVGANATHGLPRSNADKRRAVECLLRDDEWSQWSNREIARRAAVGSALVDRMRHELSASKRQIDPQNPSGNGYQMEPQTRLVQRNGTTYEQTVRPPNPNLSAFMMKLLAKLADHTDKHGRFVNSTFEEYSSLGGLARNGYAVRDQQGYKITAAGRALLGLPPAPEPDTPATPVTDTQPSDPVPDVRPSEPQTPADTADTDPDETQPADTMPDISEDTAPSTEADISTDTQSDTPEVPAPDPAEEPAAQKLGLETGMMLAGRKVVDKHGVTGAGMYVELVSLQIGNLRYVRRHKSGDFTAYFRPATLGTSDGTELIGLVERIRAAGFSVHESSYDTWYMAYLVRFSKPDELTTQDFVPEDHSDPKLALVLPSESPEWYTPPALMDHVRMLFPDGIELDPASCQLANSVVRARRFFDQDADGLTREWNAETLYMNPPYGDTIGDWIDKLIAEVEAGRVRQALILLPANTDTAWFRKLRQYPKCFVHGRIRFWNAQNPKDPYRRPNVFVAINVPLKRFRTCFEDVGDVYVLAEE